MSALAQLFNPPVIQHTGTRLVSFESEPKPKRIRLKPGEKYKRYNLKRDREKERKRWREWYAAHKGQERERARQNYQRKKCAT